MITTTDLKKKYLDFFHRQGHAIIASASLIPENDPTVLFTTAGMHPLVPYLTGQKHPAGKRLVDVQKCIRTGDIDEVGDTTHLTFFEMLGNWSLGDYWKKEAITWSFEFLTKELSIPVTKLAVSCFAGDNDAPRDDESADLWRSLGIPDHKIAFLPKENNWWGPAGTTGPCGPDTEMFFFVGLESLPPDSSNPGTDPGHWVEIWNDVFMQYFKEADGTYRELEQKNVDTGMGVERTTTILNGHNSVFDTEPLSSIVTTITGLTEMSSDQISAGQNRAIRIIADHLRAATFMLAERLEPSNVERGYVLRRLIRRSVRYGRELGISTTFTFKIAEAVIDAMRSDYPELKNNQDFIIEQLVREEEKFARAIQEGLRAAESIFVTKKSIDREKFIALMQAESKEAVLHDAFEKKRLGQSHGLTQFGITESEFNDATISGEESFYLYQSFGLPIEMILELVREKYLFVSTGDFRQQVEQHQALSRTATAGRFKGGLADHSEATTKLHTTTHLLLAALRRVLGPTVFQKGSNITADRLRLDVSHPDKITAEQLAQVEGLVNGAISQALAVTWAEVDLEEARRMGAMGVFDSKYNERVKVYTVGDPANPFSREICGGPHVENTSILGHFKITKEEASSAGVRRIKAILE